MDSKQKRKEMARAYKEEKEYGCVCLYENTKNNRYLICGEVNMRGAISKFAFAKKHNSCMHGALQADWDQYGEGAFTQRVLETLERKPEQNGKEFAKELETLAEIYRQERPPELSY